MFKARDHHYARWKKAVQRTMKWEVDDVENQGNKSKLYYVISTLNQCKMVFKCMWKNIVFVDVVFDHYPGCGLMRSI